MTVRNKIRMRTSQLRRMRHMTQKELARRAHLSKTTISNIESGRQAKIELETISKLCDALECDPKDLFELVQEHSSNLVRSQKSALKKYLGSLDYDKDFEPHLLDEDLAKIIDDSKWFNK